MLVCYTIVTIKVLIDEYMPYKPKITPGQGLLLLIQHYQDDPNKVNQLKKLYLRGACDGDSCIDLCTFLLEEPLLDDYELVIDEHSINADPSRRYFETHLAYETLQHQLPNMALRTLRYFYSKSAALVDQNISEHKRKTINEVFKGECLEPSFHTKENRQINAYIKRIKEGSIFQDLSENAREKIKWLVRINYMGMVNGWRQTDMPIDIYRTHDWFVNKGKISHTREQLSTGNQHFGLMKSYMPLARNDKALASIPFTHVKSTEYNHFDRDSELVQACFQQLVHPFSNSISGLFLVQLRVMARLQQDNPKSTFTRSTEDFIQFIRLFLSTSLYYSGGHSLYEYMFVLKMAEVQEAFQCIPEFSALDLADLFYHGNESAFEVALQRTIHYNAQLSERKAIHYELLSHGFFKPPSPVGVDELQLIEFDQKVPNMLKKQRTIRVS